MKLLYEKAMIDFFMFGELFGYARAKEVFGELCKIYMLDEKDDSLQEAYRAAIGENVMSMKTISAYYRYKRVCEYEVANAIPSCYTQLENELFILKGRALITMKEAKLLEDNANTGTMAVQRLTDSAMDGNIVARRIFALAAFGGEQQIRNAFTAKEMLDSVAQWCDVCGLLYALRYGEDRMLNLSRLRTADDKTGSGEIFSLANCVYNETAEAIHSNDIAEILWKAFFAKKLDAKTFDKQMARILGATAISFADKEKLVYSQNPQIKDDTSALPLYVGKKGKAVFDWSKVSVLKYREAETEKVKKLVGTFDNSSFGTDAVYIQCKDAYAALYYADVIKNAGSANNVVVIDATKISSYDLEPNGGNVFVRYCDEDATNLYIVFVQSGARTNNANEFIANAVTSIANAQFRLAVPSVDLDLSSVSVVVIGVGSSCDDVFGDRCEVVDVAASTEEERIAAVKALVADGNEKHRGVNVFVTDSAIKKISRYPAKDAISVINRIFALAKSSKGTFEVTEKTVDDIGGKVTAKRQKLGFGGDDNEK